MSPVRTQVARWHVLLALRLFVILLGVASAWLTRDGTSADGVAYLDASDVFLAGEWPASRTGYWSPAYPTLLAVARRVGGTDPAREQAIAQVVNVLVFLIAFAALEYFVRSFRRPGARRPGSGTTSVPQPNDFAWQLLVYALFGWLAIGWIGVWMLTPDMLVAAIVFAIAGACLRLSSETAGRGTALALGGLLGVGYLTKAALFPFALVLLATLAVARRQRRGVSNALLAGVVFLAVSAPQIAYVSRLKGAPTFSDVGRVSYAWFIADVPGPLSSVFALPARLPDPNGGPQSVPSLESQRGSAPGPAIYGIDAPIPGTLPIWYDATYWYRRVVAPFRPVRLARAFVRHTRVYLLEMLPLLIVGGLAAAAAGRVSRRSITALRPVALLVVPALAVFAMYALVTIQPRYVAPFALLLVAGLVPPPALDPLSQRVRAGFAVAALVGLMFATFAVRRDVAYWRGSARGRADVVAALRERGVHAGAKIGFIGEAYDAYWARLGRYRIASIIPEHETGWFWSSDAARRAMLIDTMRAHGATAIISEAPPGGVDVTGWVRLPYAGVPKGALMLYELRATR